MTRVAVAVIFFLLLGGCASDAGNGPEENATSDSFDEDVADLCSETASAKDDAVSGADLDENLDTALAAHRDLEGVLADLQPPPERADAFDAYLAELSVYVDAMERGYSEEEAADALGALVDNARSAVKLEELAEPAGIPGDCPPGADVSVHNTLFVTEANLGCFELSEDLLVAGPIQTPKSPQGIRIVLDLGKSVSAGIAGVIRRADSPDVDDRIPIEELVRANKERFMAVEALADTFRNADFAAYKQAAKRLKTISRRADQLALSVGLVQCAKVFNLLPFWR